MVYINTLIIQELLSDPAWANKLTLEDKRALTPLIHAHINPYGLFPLDLYKRLSIAVEKEIKNDRTKTNTRQAESEPVAGRWVSDDELSTDPSNFPDFPGQDQL